MAAEVRPRLSPWRDAWYLEDQTSSVSDQSIAVSDPPAATPSQAWDTWYLEEEFTSARKAAASGGTASSTALGD
jgi:hypothetical protein